MTAPSETTETFPFQPDYAVHPGEVIGELLEEIGMKQAHLAGACRVSPKHMNQVIHGVKPLHAPLAVAIEFATGRAIAPMLMRMQSDYDVHHERRHRAEQARLMGDYFNNLSGNVTPGGDAT